MSNVTLKFIIYLSILVGICGISRFEYKWQNSKLWSSCSKTCGVGSQKNLLSCVKKTLIGTYEKVLDKECKNIRKPFEKIIKACFLGNCPINESSEYIWKVSEWSSCSASCGGDGIRTREVQCILSLSSGSYTDAKYQDCKAELEPSKIGKCGYFDCPPEFFKTSWKKCSKMRGCLQPGIRRRKINCLVTLKNGTSKSVAAGNCYRRSKPPTAWEKCLQDPEYQSKCQFKDKKEKRKPPIISVSNLKIHQMRRTKKLKLNVGQTAYVLPHTRLVIKCPVKNFPYENLQWIRNNTKYVFIRGSKHRILVTRKGYLIIKKFSTQDEGTWICKAGVITAKIRLLTKNPSQGYSDWLSRTIYFKQDIIQGKNDSAIKYIKPVFYQWVISQWSTCTKSCGSGGFQNRYVNCELIEPRYFVKVDDNKCLSENIKKPESIRSCVLFLKCPVWSVGEASTHKCTNTCVDIGKSIKDIRVTCKYENRILPLSNCDSLSQPRLACPNLNCSVFWKTEEWSPCSSSCGEIGLSVRTVSCRWRNDNSQAGNLCYRTNIRMPLLIRTCSPPPCNLGCMDLSKYCGLKKLCSIDHYQHFCCKTCNID